MSLRSGAPVPGPRHREQTHGAASVTPGRQDRGRESPTEEAGRRGSPIGVRSLPLATCRGPGPASRPQPSPWVVFIERFKVAVSVSFKPGFRLSQKVVRGNTLDGRRAKLMQLKNWVDGKVSNRRRLRTQCFLHKLNTLARQPDCRLRNNSKNVKGHIEPVKMVLVGE